MVNEALKLAFRQFDLTAEPVDILPLGNGHINETHLVTCLKGEKYVLQKINQQASKDISEMVGKRVYLSLFVKVEEDWLNKSNKLFDLGYLQKNNED